MIRNSASRHKEGFVISGHIFTKDLLAPPILQALPKRKDILSPPLNTRPSTDFF